MKAMSPAAPSPRGSDSFDEERDTLLHNEQPQPKPTRTGAVWQIVTFTIVGLLIALASGAFAYTLRQHKNSEVDFVHAPLPGLKDPTILRDFGGMGPYIGAEYVFPPNECKVSQVHMISRHGERYPTTHMGSIIANFATNISSLPKNNFRKSLSFLNGWTIATDNWIVSPGDQLEQETLTGPAAGSTRLFTLGSEFRSRYPDLWDFTHHDNKAMALWSSNSTRVIHSARYFATGFFGVDVRTEVQIIPETEDRWGNSLTTTYVPLYRNG
jgi:hypothetical protein